VNRFPGGRLAEGASELSFEQTQEALLGLVGRPVRVLFSGAHGRPFIAGLASGRVAGGELGQALER